MLGLLTADGRERNQLLRATPMKVRMPDELAVGGHDVLEGDEVAEDQPEEHVLAVQVDQGVEEAQ